MDSIMRALPQLTEKIAAHQAQLLHTLNDNSEFCKLTTTVIKEVQRNQSFCKDRIQKLEKMVSKMVHHTTSSSGRTKKKPKSKYQEIIFLQQSSAESENYLQPTQLDMLLDNNTSSITDVMDNINTHLTYYTIMMIQMGVCPNPKI
jgi:hypothetical protein